MSTKLKAATDVEIRTAHLSVKALATSVNRYHTAPSQQIKEKLGKTVPLKFYQLYEPKDPQANNVVFANFLTEKGSKLESLPDSKNQGDVYDTIVGSVTTKQLYELFGNTQGDIVKGLDEIKKNSKSSAEMLAYFS